MADLIKIVENLKTLNLETDELWLNRYLTFVEQRNRDSKLSDQLYERHHVLPKCLFEEKIPFTNSSENLTYLTLREHFIAHLILTKVFFTVSELSIAAYLMSSKHTSASSRSYSSLRKEAYGCISKKSIEVWGTTKRREQHALQLKTMWSPEARKLQSERSKTLWENEDHRNSIKKKSIERGQDPNYRVQQSETMKMIFENPEYLEKRKEFWSSPEFKESQSKKARKQWENEELRKKQSEIVKKRYLDPKYVKKMKDYYSKPETKENKRIATEKQFNDPVKRATHKAAVSTKEFKEKVSKSLKKRLEDPFIREERANRSKERWENPVFRAKFDLSWARKRLLKNPTDLGLLEDVRLKQEIFEKLNIEGP